MSEDNKRIVEINGIKMEVDLREAKQINQYKVGDPVKVLVEEYSNDYRNYYGVIVGFTEFQSQPAIDLIYVKNDYSDADIKFVTITEETKKIEIAPVHDYDVSFSKADVLGKINKKIEGKQEEVRVLEAKKKAFLKYFGQQQEG